MILLEPARPGQPRKWVDLGNVAFAEEIQADDPGGRPTLILHIPGVQPIALRGDHASAVAERLDRRAVEGGA